MPLDPRQKFLDEALRLGVIGHELERAARARLDAAKAAGRSAFDLAGFLLESGVPAGELRRVELAIDPAATRDAAQTVISLPAEPSLRRRAGLEDSALATSRSALAGGPRYQPTGLLGRGGMGVVYEATDRDLVRQVAVKTLVEDPIEGPSREMRARSVEESQLTGQLEHPGIVPVHDLGLEPGTGRPYLVLKKVRGTTLGEVLDRVKAGLPTGLGENAERGTGNAELPGGDGGKNRRRDHPGRRSSARIRAYGAHEERGESPEQALVRLLGVFAKVADAVAYAHSRGVIHRDLKPSNVMTGEFGEVLVMDWGLATTRNAELGTRNSGSGTGDGAVTREGAVVGTPMYMPPEQARGEIDRLDERSDIYALGAILYQIISLSPPIEAEHPDRVLYKAAKGEVRPPSERWNAPWPASRELESVVMKAMAREPRKRYRSARELKAEIEAYLAGRTLGAARYSTLEVLAKWARRNKAAAIGIVATTIALVLGAAGIAWVVARGQARELAAADQARRKEAADRGVAAADLFDEGQSDWEDAAREFVFNPAAPQDYFRAHMASLMKMGRALASHPSPPRDWSALVAERASTIQELAHRVGDWTLAQVGAELAGDWRAYDSQERTRRLQAVGIAMDQAAAEDRERLDRHLERLAQVEGKQGVLIPGEIPERALRLARATKPAFTGALIDELAGGPASGLVREFLIETLGRKGDATTRASGRSAPELVRTALEAAAEHADPKAADQSAAWIRAAARLEARSPGAFEGLPELVAAVSAAHHDIGPVAAAARAAIAGTADPAELADEVAAQVRVRGRYTRELVERAESPRTSPRALAAIYEQLGLHHDTRSPEPDRPRGQPAAVLERAFDCAWAVYSDRRVLADERSQARDLATAAALALSRLEAEGFARKLHKCRYTAQNDLGDSLFGSRTDLAIGLVPIWSDEPRTAADFNDRGLARRDQGDLAGAVSDYSRAIELDPAHWVAYVNRGLLRSHTGDMGGAILDLERALALPAADPDYTHFFLWIVRSRAGSLAEATRSLREYFASRVPGNGTGWTVQLAAFLPGDLDEEGLFAWASQEKDDRKRSGYLCEAHYYAGMKRLLAGDRAGARDHFASSVETGRTTFLEYGEAQIAMEAIDSGR